MVTRTIVRFTDDLDGTEGTNEDIVTVQFALQGLSYEIDLSQANRDNLRNALQPYVDAGRKVRNGKAKPEKQKGPSDRQVRDWARMVGIEVTDRGRVSPEVRRQYEAAH